MWPWQRRTIPHKYFFLRNVFFASTVVHFIALFIMLFVYQGDRFNAHLTLLPSDVKIVVLPFQKTVKHTVSPQALPQGGHTESKTSQNIEADAEPSPVHTMLSPAKLIKKTGKKVKAVVKKTMKAHTSVPQKKHEEVPEQSKPLPEVPSLPPSQSDNVIYVGQEDLAVLELSTAVRDELVRVWHPPVLGNKECVVRVLVDWQGFTREITFEKSSKIIAFDASVRHAVRAMKFPKGAWGKELVIPFRS